MSDEGEWRAAQRGAVPVAAKDDPFAARSPFPVRRGGDAGAKGIANEVIPPAPRPTRRPMPRPELDTPPAPVAPPAPVEPVEPKPAVTAAERPRWKDTLQHLVKLSAWWPTGGATSAKDVVATLLARQQAFDGLVTRLLQELDVETSAANRQAAMQVLMALFANGQAPEEAELLVAVKALQGLSLPAVDEVEAAPLETVVVARLALLQLAVQLDLLWGHIQWPMAAGSTTEVVAAVARIARELTVAWCKQQGIADRNRVYREVLVVAAQAAYAECARRWWEGFRPAQRVRLESLWDDMPGVRKALLEMHMGHVPEEGLFDALLAQLHQAIARQATRFPAPASWGFYQQEEWRSTVCRVLADMMGAAWRDAVNEVRLRAEAMSPEELAAWMANEGAAPMPVAPVLEGFERKALAWPGPCVGIQFDLAACAQSVRERLTVLWGVSDALSKAH